MNKKRKFGKIEELIGECGVHSCERVSSKYLIYNKFCIKSIPINTYLHNITRL